jgi:hypothetical protein
VQWEKGGDRVRKKRKSVIRFIGLSHEEGKDEKGERGKEAEREESSSLNTGEGGDEEEEKKRKKNRKRHHDRSLLVQRNHNGNRLGYDNDDGADDQLHVILLLVMISNRGQRINRRWALPACFAKA